MTPGLNRELRRPMCRIESERSVLSCLALRDLESYPRALSMAPYGNIGEDTLTVPHTFLGAPGLPRCLVRALALKSRDSSRRPWCNSPRSHHRD